MTKGKTLSLGAMTRKIITVFHEIAFQTSIVSLNAAVEPDTARPQNAGSFPLEKVQKRRL
jgi:hypothetical protein